jgi:predicted PurR-regulated permease PerM
VIVAAIVIYMIIAHWGETIKFIANLINVLSPFLIGVLIAYFLNPLVNKIQGLLQGFMKKKKQERAAKAIAILISYVVVLGFIAVAFIFVLPQIGQSIQELTEKIPDMYRQVMKEMLALQRRYPDIDFKMAIEQFSQVIPNLVDYGTNLVGNLLPMVYSVSVSIVKTTINIILGIIVSIYMIYSKEKFRFQAKQVVYAFFPEEKGDALCITLRECNDIFSAFLISKAIDSLIIGCICCVVMNIIGLPYAVLLSVIVGITNMIPYFGPFIGAVPGVLIYLCTDWEAAIVFAIMILILQQFDGLILGPRLLGQSTGLSPIWVIFAITVGGAYFGILGMFIGVPVVAVIAYLLNKLIVSRLAGKKVKALEEFKKE